MLVCMCVSVCICAGKCRASETQTATATATVTATETKMSCRMRSPKDTAQCLSTDNGHWTTDDGRRTTGQRIRDIMCAT